MKNAFAALALLGLVTSCASTKPLALKGDENLAVIYTTPVDCIARGACVARVSVQAINGKAVNKFTTTYNYKVEPGELSVIVLLFPISGDGLKGSATGICELKWTAVAGEIYTLDRTVEAAGFLVTATARNGSQAASCFAPFS